MRKLALILTIGFCSSAPVCAIEKEKVCGTWTVESGPDKVPKGTVFEFTADGKLKLTIMGKTLDIGTYSVAGKILTITPTGGKDGKATITTLTDDKMVLKDDFETMDLVFIKKKPKK